MEKAVRSLFNKGVVLLVFVALLDIISTYIALKYGGAGLFEGNSLVRLRIDSFGVVSALLMTFLFNIIMIMFFIVISFISLFDYAAFIFIWAQSFHICFIVVSNVLLIMGVRYTFSYNALNWSLFVLGVFVGLYLLYVSSESFRDLVHK